ncbi:MAG: hypothetical protein HY514_00690 [Candidatus Aenigmarchaeota archaeon]|nr:hypothetical protein [Candidatus Aenigmarchaeota archaeon]
MMKNLRIGRILISSESLGNLAFVRMLPQSTTFHLIAYFGEKTRPIYLENGVQIEGYVCKMLRSGAEKVEVRYRREL